MINIVISSYLTITSYQSYYNASDSKKEICTILGKEQRDLNYYQYNVTFTCQQKQMNSKTKDFTTNLYPINSKVTCKIQGLFFFF